jgi:hypothetical protein
MGDRRDFKSLPRASRAALEGVRLLPFARALAQ